MPFKVDITSTSKAVQDYVAEFNIRLVNYYEYACQTVRESVKDLASRKKGGGRWYTITYERNVKGQKKSITKRYQASAPGEPPVKASGRYWQSITSEIRVIGVTSLGFFQLQGRIGSDYQVGPWFLAGLLEFGTEKMKPRPHYKPGLDSKNEELKTGFVQFFGPVL